MDLKYAGVIFCTVPLTEMGDNTQLATMVFASDRESSKYLVFIANGAALLEASGLGVLAGGMMGRDVNERVLHWAVGAGFILIDGNTLCKG